MTHLTSSDREGGNGQLASRREQEREPPRRSDEEADEMMKLGAARLGRRRYRRTWQIGKKCKNGANEATRFVRPSGRKPLR